VPRPDRAQAEIAGSPGPFSAHAGLTRKSNAKNSGIPKFSEADSDSGRVDSPGPSPPESLGVMKFSEFNCHTKLEASEGGPGWA
jgi:hypothetical protein